MMPGGGRHGPGGFGGHGPGGYGGHGPGGYGGPIGAEIGEG